MWRKILPTSLWSRNLGFAMLKRVLRVCKVEEDLGNVVLSKFLRYSILRWILRTC